MNYFLSVFFIIVIIYAIRKERRVLGTPSSPLFIVVSFNLSILALYHITAKYLGFHALSFSTLAVLLYGCFIFACVSLLHTSNRRRSAHRFKQIQLMYVDDYPDKGLILLAFLTIIIMVLKMLTLGINDILEDEDSAALFGSSGVSGHILVLQILLTAHFIGRKFSKLSIIAVVGLIFCLFVYNVKAWIIIPFLIGWFIRRDLRGMKMNPIVLVLVPLVVFAIFTTSYMVSLGWETDNMNFIWAHFCKYVYAGIGGMNEALSHNYSIGTAPWYGTPSFIRFFFPVEIKASAVYDHVIINDLNGEYTNVYSLFGGAFLLNGPLIGTFYILIIAIISSILYVKRLKTNNYWFYFSYYLWSSGLILSFFGNYYTLLNVWEFTAEAYFIGIWFRNRNNGSTRKNIFTS